MVAIYGGLIPYPVTTISQQKYSSRTRGMQTTFDFPLFLETLLRNVPAVGFEHSTPSYSHFERSCGRAYEEANAQQVKEMKSLKVRIAELETGLKAGLNLLCSEPAREIVCRPLYLRASFFCTTLSFSP